MKASFSFPAANIYIRGKKTGMSYLPDKGATEPGDVTRLGRTGNMHTGQTSGAQATEQGRGTAPYPALESKSASLPRVLLKGCPGREAPASLPSRAEELHYCNKTMIENHCFFFFLRGILLHNETGAVGKKGKKSEKTAKST